ncbi:MAG: AmmeMemoRadiSam system radical SAM enzyme [Syntrophales bacterium]|nr:AmmeMemoRadiSam system radical SAM enzyme [Syntrophales bacterium]MDD5640548.1 AmmeMemoRadiSam system radical SAM enzyme [Syntrophales bacterium]
MKEARFWESLENQKVHCHLCAHECQIDPGKRGICRVRENLDGTLYSLVYGRIISQSIDPIEKKPLYHFLPGSSSYSIATVGCNFQCLHCQNYEISQYPRLHEGGIIGLLRSPEDIVAAALESQSASISYTYTEPTIFLEFAQDTARLARAQGLRNVFVSNGFMTKTSAQALAEFIDADNVDLKSFRDDHYRKVCKARLQPVLDTIVRLKQLGVWLEITTLVIPGLNDSTEELTDIAQFVKGVGVGVPWHVSAFYPIYKMLDRPRTPVAILLKAREIGLKAGLRYVYTGNIPGNGGESTFCYACGALLIDRLGLQILRYDLQDGKCPKCQAEIDGVWK